MQITIKNKTISFAFDFYLYLHEHHPPSICCQPVKASYFYLYSGRSRSTSPGSSLKWHQYFRDILTRE
nr:MAG TPA: hypothetical protein [Caudoviricetes sp.]